MRARSVVLCFLLVAGPVTASAETPPNVVSQWAGIVQPAIHSAAAPRAAGSAQVLHTMVVLAMYDAVMAIQGGYEPYAAIIQPSPGANVRAAVATAAYRTARARVAPSQVAYLDQQYASYLANIAPSQAKTDGIEVGDGAANAMLTLRLND